MTAGVVVRRARADDAEAVARLSTELGYPAVTAETAGRLSTLLEHPEHCLLAAVVNEQVVGWIHGFRSMRVESDASVEIGGLVVAATRQGQGIGRALVEKLRDWAEGQEVTTLRVRCRTRRAAAHAFYEHLGFTGLKTQRVFTLSLPVD